MSPETLLTADEAAPILGVSGRTVRRMADRGDLPYRRKLPGLNGDYLFDRSVVELVARQLVKAAEAKAATA